MNTLKVYRNGSVSVGKHSASIHDIWGSYDAVKPAERSGRLTSVYASPSLSGMTSWAYGNHMAFCATPDVDLDSYEITVKDIENIYIYNLSIYDETLNTVVNKETGSEALARAYWDSGIPLSQWQAFSDAHQPDPNQWEVLIPMDAIVSHAKISDRKLLDAASSDIREELRAYLGNHKEYLKWRNWEPSGACV